MSIAATATTICSGTSVTFTATPSNGGSSPVYQWKVNNADVGTGGNTYSYTPINNDQVAVVLTSNALCTTGNPATSNTVTMTVNSILPAGVSIAASATTICAGTSVTFTATPTNGGATPAYQWQLNGGNVGTNSATYTNSTLSNNDIVACVMTSGITCASGNPATSNPVTMTVNPALPVSVSIAASATTICAGTSVTFTATPVNAGTTPVYQWKLNGSDVGSNSPTYTNAALTNGNVVTCILTSNATCATGSPATSNTINMTVNPVLPVSVSIASSPSGAICSGTSVTFTATPANGGTTPVYQWLLNGSNVGSNSTTYTSAALANGDIVTCQLTSNAICATGNPATSNAITAIVNPNLPVSVSIAASPLGAICAGTSVTFTATPVNGGTTPAYQWKLNGVNVGSNLSTYTNAALSNGDLVTCQLTSNATCATGSPATSNTINMTVNPVLPVSVSISASANPVCSGTSVTFTATPSNGGSSPVYQWKVNNADVGTGGNTYSYTPINNDQVAVVLTSNALCTTGNPATSNTVTMTVNSILPAGVSIAASSTTICAGTSVTFTATPTNGGATPAYQWQLNGGNVGTNSATYTNSTLSNNDIVACVMTSGITCASGNPATSNPVTMTVNPALPVSVSIAASATTICAGTSVTFTATPVNAGTTPVYQWKLNGSDVGSNSPTYTNAALTNGNVVTCILTSNATCATGSPATSNTINMTVNPVLPVSVSIASSPSGAICSGTSVTFTATPANGGTTPVYQWLLNGSNVGSNSTTYTSAALANGDIVTCQLTSNAICATGNPATSNAITAIVNPNLPVSVSIAASPLGAICAGTSVTFTATPVNGGTTPAYQWKLNGNNVGSNSATYTNSSLSNSDVVTCVLTSDITCTSGNPATSSGITMTVNSLPAITVTTPATCAPDLLTYSVGVTVSSGAVTSTLGTVVNTTGNLWTISGVPAGTGITITVTDGNSCVNSISVNSPVCSCPPVNAPVSGGNKAYCSGSSVPSISATVQAGETVDWYAAAFGGSALATGVTSYTPSGAGTYYAEARNTSSNCVSSTRTGITVTLNSLPVVSITGASSVCIGQTTTLSPTSGGSWVSDSPGVASVNSSGVVTGLSAGTATFTFTDAVTLCTRTTTQVTVTAQLTYYRDADLDNYGQGSAILGCTVPAGYSLISGDCNDSNAAIHPGAVEIPGDGIDQNCDARESCYVDVDDDNYGTSSTFLSIDSDCMDANEAAVPGDCDDSNAAVNPGAVEICGNGIDDNCTLGIDECVTLTVNTGNGGGIVTSNPAGINCGAVCTYKFAPGTIVTLTATPAATATFAGWSGACSGTSTCAVVMNSDKTVSARFTYALAITKIGTGSGTVVSAPAGINCGSTCLASFDAGLTVNLTATASPGSVFVSWGGDASACGTSTICNVSMTSAKNVTAQFDCIIPATPGTITGNASACAGSSQTYSVASDPMATEYVWSMPLGWGGSSTTNSITATAGVSGAITVLAKNACGESSVQSLNVNVTSSSVATFIYTNTPYCSNGTNPIPTFSGGGVAGTFSSTSGLNFVSTATGEVNLSGSTAGTYTVTNTIAASGGCAVVTATSPITITAIPAATISYTGTPFCRSAGPVNVTRTGASGGAYSVLPSGLSIDPSTGTITPSTSTAGSYTVTYTIAAANGCGVVTATAPVTITALPAATFSYTGTPYCSNGTNPSPVFSGGGVAGTFTSTAGLNFVSTATGVVNLSGSTAGSYTVTNTIAASGGCAVVTATSPITITTLPAATISYSGTPFCRSAGIVSVTRTGTAGGTYSVSPSGLSIDPSTGTITPGTSTAGSYTVTYTIAAANGCGVVTATAPVTITAVPTASISYSGTPFCTSLSSPQTVALSGTGAYTGGTFTSAVGLTINSSTGAITPSSSTAGPYTVTYTIPASGGCSSVAVTAAVTITALPAATFSYTGTPYCSNGTNPSPVFSGGGVAGTFTSTAGLNFVSTATGVVNLSGSTAGSYTVTNTIAASGGCAVVTATSPIIINTAPASITGNLNVCVRSASTLASTTSGGTWSSSNPAVATINSSGVVTGISAGTSLISYTLGTGCVSTATVTVTLCSRLLTLNSVLLEGLYDGGGEMYQAQADFGPKYGPGIADHINIELRSASNYSTIVYIASDVPLTTAGVASVEIPAIYDGSYYITVRHRNSLETTTNAPVLFSGSALNRSFGTTANVYGGNLGNSYDNHRVIYAGDVNQDGYIDTQDYLGVDNDSYNYVFGYVITDVDGSGLVDTNDYIFIDNNNYNYIGHSSSFLRQKTKGERQK